MIAVLVGLFMGAAAVALAYFIIKPGPGARGALFGMVLVLLLIAGQFAGYKYVTPRVQAAIAGPSLDDEALFRTIRKHEPEMYARLEREYKAALKAGDKDAFMQSAISEVGTLAQKHLPKASNKSVNDFMGHAVVQLKELQRKPGDACYRFLFPKVSGPADLSVLPKSMVDANATYLEAVLVSAIERPQEMPSESQSMQTLQPILMRLANSYGQDLQLLARPGGSGVERRRVCEISIDLYDQILALPADESANVLRFMITKA
jgi:hypothetical protein